MVKRKLEFICLDYESESITLIYLAEQVALQVCITVLQCSFMLSLT